LCEGSRIQVRSDGIDVETGGPDLFVGQPRGGQDFVEEDYRVEKSLQGLFAALVGEQCFVVGRPVFRGFSDEFLYARLDGFFHGGVHDDVGDFRRFAGGQENARVDGVFL